MRRVGRVIGLDAAGIAEYERLHEHPWPAVLDRLRRSNITNYTIYRYGELLFSYYEYRGDDYEADLAAIAADEQTQQWWALCKPLQRTLSTGDGEGQWWTTLPEVFRLD